MTTLSKLIFHQNHSLSVLLYMYYYGSESSLTRPQR